MRGHLRVTLGSAWQEPGSVSKAAATRRRIVGEERREFSPPGSESLRSPRAPSRVRGSPRPARTERRAGTPGRAPFVAPAAVACPRRFRGVCRFVPGWQVHCQETDSIFVRWKKKEKRKKRFWKKTKSQNKKHSAQDRYSTIPRAGRRGKRPGPGWRGGERLIIAASLDFGLGRLRFGR